MTNTTPNNKLTPVQLHALNVLGKKAKGVRKLLPVGEHELDFGIHVTGKLIVGSDQSYSATSKPSLEQLAAALISRLPKRGRVRIIKEIIESGLLVDAESECELSALATTLIEGTTVSQSKDRRGNVTGKLTTDLVATLAK